MKNISATDPEEQRRAGAGRIAVLGGSVSITNAVPSTLSMMDDAQTSFDAVRRHLARWFFVHLTLLFRQSVTLCWVWHAMRPRPAETREPRRMFPGSLCSGVVCVCACAPLLLEQDQFCCCMFGYLSGLSEGREESDSRVALSPFSYLNPVCRLRSTSLSFLPSSVQPHPLPYPTTLDTLLLTMNISL